MKKDLIFAPILLVIGVLLFLLKLTGLPVHIAVSAVGVVTLVAYSVLTKKEWKIFALEIIMRAFYGVALITGIIIINAQDVAAVAVIHRVSAALFVVLLLALSAHKLVTAKKSK